MNKKLTSEQAIKLHCDTIQQVLKFSDYLRESGMEKMGWTLTNDFKVTITDVRKKGSKCRG
jgi:hypothetical protein